MSDIIVTTARHDSFPEFLNLNGFSVEILDNNIIQAVRDGEMPVFISMGDEVVYFEVDLGPINEVLSKELLFELLDANTEVIPVSFAINSANAEDPRLVLVESREAGDLCDKEVLAVFDGLELAVDRAESILQKYMKA